MDATKLSTRILNASTALHESDRFNVRFLGIADNIADFMSRQVNSVTPRTITFEPARHTNRRATFEDVGKITKEGVQLQMKADDEGILNAIIIMQIMRQKGVKVTGFAQDSEGPDRFSMSIAHMNAAGDKVYEEVYKRCFIQNFSYGDLTVSGPAPSMLSVLVNYDQVEYKMVAGLEGVIG